MLHKSDFNNKNFFPHLQWYIEYFPLCGNLYILQWQLLSKAGQKTGGICSLKYAERDETVLKC